jgi:hypothetical protein
MRLNPFLNLNELEKAVMIEVAPYLLNVIILVPVCMMMFFGNNKDTVQAFQATVVDSPGLRLLVGSLWFSILICSVLGLNEPKKFVPILLMQWIYKTVFIVSYIIPHYIRYGTRLLPTGITATFSAIILVWPYFIFLLWR